MIAILIFCLLGRRHDVTERLLYPGLERKSIEPIITYLFALVSDCQSIKIQKGARKVIQRSKEINITSTEYTSVIKQYTMDISPSI